MSLGGDTKNRQSLLPGVYASHFARVSKITHQSALACVNVVDYTTLKALPHVRISSTISSTMVFNVAKIASARASLTISLTKSLRVAGPLEKENSKNNPV